MKIFKFFKGLCGALEKKEEIDVPKILVPPIYDDVAESEEKLLVQRIIKEHRKYVEDWKDSRYPKKQELPLTEKLIEIVSNSNKSLHYRKIYNIVVNEFDNTKDMYTVKATLYYLSRKKKIENGKKPGTFKAKRRTKKA